MRFNIEPIIKGHRRAECGISHVNGKSSYEEHMRMFLKPGDKMVVYDIDESRDCKIIIIKGIHEYHIYRLPGGEIYVEWYNSDGEPRWTQRTKVYYEMQVTGINNDSDAECVSRFYNHFHVECLHD